MMRPSSADFLAAVREPHDLYVRVMSTPPGATEAVPVPVTEGTVALDGSADTRGRLELTVPRTSPPRDDDDPLSPYGAWLTVERGVRYPSAEVEAVQVGRFRVESVEADLAAGTVKVVAFDASRAIRDDRFLAPRTIAAGTAYTSAIATLATETLPGLIVAAEPIATTLAADAVFDRERWQAIRELAAAIGCDAWIDGAGVLVVAPPPAPDAEPVYALDAGPHGVLVSVSEAMTRESAYNAVVAIGESLNGAPPARGVAYDLTSPIRWDGPYGHNPRFYASSLLATDAQALSAAEAILAAEMGVERRVDLGAVPCPALEPGDPVIVTYPDRTSETHVLAAVTIPLAAESAMTARTRITRA